MFECIAALLSVATFPTTLELLIVLCGTLFRKKKQKRIPYSHQVSFFQKAVVLIPAHNEEKLIGNTIESLKNSHQEIQIYVVLDHCTDGTCRVAIEKGAKVIDRVPSSKKGKTEALQEAFSFLLKGPYEWFIVIDADSIVEENFFEEVSKAFLSGAKAIQTRYDVLDPHASWRHRLMRVAFWAFNGLRPLGRFGLGLSCGILGNGFGVTKKVLESVPFPIDTIVEDLAYHLKLVEAGFKVDFVSTTSVFGSIPSKGTGVMTQRMRWEGGRFALMRNELPGLIKKFFQGKIALFEPILELASLPLAFYVLLLVFLCVIPSLFFQGVAFFSLTVVLVYLMTAIFLGGGGFSDICILFFAPFYVLWKIGVLFRLFFKRKSNAWEKTERD